MREYTDPLQNDPKIRRRRRDEDWLRAVVVIALVAALVFHGLGYISVKHLPSFHFAGRENEDGSGPFVSRTLPTQILSQAQFEKIVVDSKKVKATERNANETSRFLGEQTQRVERETVNPNFGDPDGGGSKSRSRTQNLEGDGKTARRPSPKSLGMGHGKVSRLLKVEEEGTGRLVENDRNDSVRGSRDHLPADIAIGADTLLNTDEYVYASFFNRLKRDVGPRWEYLIGLVFDDKKNKIGVGSYFTNTRLICDREGNIVSVEVIRRSGVSGFDEAAKQALLQTRWVANAPQDFMDLDGRIRFDLGFTIMVSDGGFRMDYVPDPRIK